MAEKKAAESTPAAPKPRVKKPKTVGEAIVGQESAERGQRKVRQGIVVSNKMAKTVVIKIERRVQHPLYGKVVLRTNKFKAHDIIGCDEGDLVEIMETRPISRDKRWRVTQILEKVK
jgi:small subunit ribosomal protein S17